MLPPEEPFLYGINVVELSAHSDISNKKECSRNSIVNFAVRPHKEIFCTLVAGPLWILHFGCADGGCLLGASYSVSLTANATSMKGLIHLSYTQ